MAKEQSARIKILVGGTNFEFETEILQKMPSSKLARLCEQLPTDKVAFFHRDPFIFNSILNFYVTGHLHFPTDICLDSIRDEMAFWELEFDHEVAPCCWNRLSQSEGAISKKIEWKKNEDSSWPTGSRLQMWHRFFEFPNSSWPAFLWAAVVLINMIMSIVGLVMSFTPTFREYNSDGHIIPMGNRYVMGLEYWSFTFLLFDYIIRLVLAPRKLGFVIQPLNVVDLLSLVVCFVLDIMSVALMPTEHSRSAEIAYFVVSAMSMVRVFRLLRLIRICRKLELTLRAIGASVIELFVLALLVAIFTLIFGTCLYFAEANDAHTQATGPLSGMWYAVITLTTVGYGDILPYTTLGKVVGSLCAMTGMLFLALPMPILFYKIDKYRSQLSATKRTEKRRQQTHLPNLVGSDDVRLEQM